MSATPRTDALEKAVSLGMVGSQLFAEVRKMDRERTAVMVARLKELSYATAEQRWREFSMRVPADTERDADLVLMRAPLLNDAADEIERLRAALNGLLDRNITYSGSNVILPFASYGMAVKLVADARSMTTPNVELTGVPPTDATKGG